MNLVFDLLQGAGIAAAIGIRPFLPLLLVGALASGDLGLDFGGTDFSFLESSGFIAGAFVLLVASVLYERKTGDNVVDGSPLIVLAVVLAVLGALEAAGSLADRDHPVVLGLVAGAACALLATVAARQVLGGARRRLEAEHVGGLAVYAEGVALVVAGASVLFPPLALVAIGGLATLLVRGRQRGEQKYAGLRILR